MGEIDFIILEELTFLVMGIAAWIYLLPAKKTLYNPVGKGEMVKCAAALTENGGNILFALAIVRNPNSYTACDRILLHIHFDRSKDFSQGKMSKKQYVCLFILSVGIILLGMFEIIKNS